MADLPLEILLLIVAHVLEPGTLASLCLVNRAFHDLAVSRLYNRIAICPWHKSSKRRVIQLFRTLTKFPNLSRLVHQLEIRDFPKGPDFQDFGVHFWGRYPLGLENCVRLKVCTWTRDGSVTSDMLRSLAKCPELTDITINGAYSRDYQPVDLVQLLRLNKISLIMPSASVLEILPRWVQATGQSLTSLTLVCKEDKHVTDSLLRSVAQYVPQLERLHLVGCPRVTHEGVWSMIKNNVGNVKDISLEALSRTLDILALGEAAMNAGGLKSLLSFTLGNHPRSSTDSWMNGTKLLLRASPLELFQIYVPNSASEGAPADTFCDHIVEQHRDQLSRFSFYHPQPISRHAIDNVCKHCPRLEELFVVIDAIDIALLIPVLAQATSLRIVHISIDEPRINGLTYARHIVHQCSPTIQQVGIGTEVWKVEKRLRTVEGVVQLDRCLIEAGISDIHIPERLLVTRT
ncbi:hypothetical protein BC827DRAFT_1170911 [Russula dissimulans]|nr:hypothetical protein BC827DRAFT_1170911 [Russula dissimulans]